MSSNRHKSLMIVADMKQRLQEIENELVLAPQVTEQQLQVLSAAQSALEQTTKWVQGKTIHAPQTRVELPKETTARRWQEREDAKIAGRPAPETYKGVAIT